MMRCGWNIIGCIGALSTVGACASSLEDAGRSDREARRHLAAAERLMGERPLGVGWLCRPLDEGRVAARALPRIVEAAQVFDNLYFVGGGVVSAWALQTREGVVLIDALGSADEARSVIVPGLRSVGLVPDAVRYVIVTHGHFDHVGGARYFQDRYDARVVMGEADWATAEAAVAEPPHRDISVGETLTLTLGETAIELHHTPGHSPGTISALIPVREGQETYTLALFGGTAFPRDAESMQAYRLSLRRFADIASAAGVDGMISNHPLFDDTLIKLRSLERRAPGDPHPFLTPREEQARMISIQMHCLDAAMARTR